MPKWTNTVPQNGKGRALPLMRTPAKTPLVALVTSNDLVGCYTHFWKNRTVPCEAPDCEPCLLGLPFRWHAYLGIWLPQRQLHCIFECTAQAAEAFTRFRDQYHTLRGCHFEARRWHESPNGRVTIRTQPDPHPDRLLPDPPNLRHCMSIIWGLPTNNVHDDTINPDKRTKQLTTAERAS